MPYEKRKVDLPDNYTGSISVAGAKYRYRNGKLHSKAMPAVEHKNGSYEFYLEGVPILFSKWIEQNPNEAQAKLKDAEEKIAALEKENKALNEELDKHLGKKAPIEIRSSWFGKIEVD